VVVSDKVGFRVGLAALEVSMRNTYFLAIAGQVSPEMAEELIESVAGHLEMVEDELDVSITPILNDQFILIRDTAKLNWKSDV
jgi:hypothetical protein